MSIVLRITVSILDSSTSRFRYMMMIMLLCSCIWYSSIRWYIMIEFLPYRLLPSVHSSDFRIGRAFVLHPLLYFVHHRCHIQVGDRGELYSFKFVFRGGLQLMMMMMMMMMMMLLLFLCRLLLLQSYRTHLSTVINTNTDTDPVLMFQSYSILPSTVDDDDDSNIGSSIAATDANPFHVHCFWFYCNKYFCDNNIGFISNYIVSFDNKNNDDPFHIHCFCSTSILILILILIQPVHLMMLLIPSFH